MIMPILPALALFGVLFVITLLGLFASSSAAARNHASSQTQNPGPRQYASQDAMAAPATAARR
jgi:hypothetical protein